MKTILSILAAALTLSLAGCNTYLESSESIYGDYVCTQLIVESDGAPHESVIDECRLCSSAYVGQRVVVEPESYLLWIGFSAEQGGHFTQVKPNRYAKRSKHDFWRNCCVVLQGKVVGKNCRWHCRWRCCSAFAQFVAKFPKTCAKTVYFFCV